LRDNLSAYDARYVALAESLNCTLVTADARLSRPPGVECSITDRAAVTGAMRI
jgi:predicted nucleic acid-binding protein